MELTGTEKQKTYGYAVLKRKQKEWPKEDPALLAQVREVLNQQTSAGFWIANKDKSLAEVVEVIAKAQTKQQETQDRTSPTPTGGPKETPQAAEGVTVVNLPEGGIRWIGPTKDARTGGIVAGDDLPF